MFSNYHADHLAGEEHFGTDILNKSMMQFIVIRIFMFTFAVLN
jgi:hypothetical protein